MKTLRFTSEELRLLDAIDWRSTDKDNMEYTIQLSVYQKNILEKLIKYYTNARDTELSLWFDP